MVVKFNSKKIVLLNTDGELVHENVFFHLPILLTPKGIAFGWRFEDLTIKDVRSRFPKHEFWNSEGEELYRLGVHGEDSFIFVPLKELSKKGLFYEIRVGNNSVRLSRNDEHKMTTSIQMGWDRESVHFIFREAPNGLADVFSKIGASLVQRGDEWIAPVVLEGKNYVHVS